MDIRLFSFISKKFVLQTIAIFSFTLSFEGKVYIFKDNLWGIIGMVNIIFLEFVQFRCKYNVIFIFINMWGIIYFKVSLAIIKCIYFTYIYIYTHTCIYVCVYTHRQFLSFWKRKGITVCTHHSGLECYRQVNSEEPVYVGL